MDIGAQLREAREARGLSIEAVSLTTRVPVQRLAAIERNDISGVPPRPYGRGFVHAYASEVGLDADATVREYFARFEPAEPVVTAQPPRPRSTDMWRKRSSLPAVAVLILLTGVVVWAGWPRGGATEETAPQAQPSETAGTAGAAQSAPVATLGATAPAPMPALSPSEVLVVLEAGAESWVAATADGKRILYETLPAGTRHAIRASREVMLRVGNAGAVTWTVNGRTIGKMGDPAVPRTAVVTAQNAAMIR